MDRRDTTNFLLSILVGFVVFVMGVAYSNGVTSFRAQFGGPSGPVSCQNTVGTKTVTKSAFISVPQPTKEQAEAMASQMALQQLLVACQPQGSFPLACARGCTSQMPKCGLYDVVTTKVVTTWKAPGGWVGNVTLKGNCVCGRDCGATTSPMCQSITCSGVDSCKSYPGCKSTCTNGKCRACSDITCTTNSDCCSGICNNGSCAQCKIPGANCASNADCCTGLVCAGIQGVCQPPEPTTTMPPPQPGGGL